MPPRGRGPTGCEKRAWCCKRGRAGAEELAAAALDAVERSGRAVDDAVILDVLGALDYGATLGAAPMDAARCLPAPGPRVDDDGLELAASGLVAVRGLLLRWLADEQGVGPPIACGSAAGGIRVTCNFSRTIRRVPAGTAGTVVTVFAAVAAGWISVGSASAVARASPLAIAPGVEYAAREFFGPRYLVEFIGAAATGSRGDQPSAACWGLARPVAAELGDIVGGGDRGLTSAAAGPPYSCRASRLDVARMAGRRCQ